MRTPTPEEALFDAALSYADVQNSDAEYDAAKARLLAAATTYEQARVPDLLGMAAAPEWEHLWTLLNGFASGKIQQQFARAEPLAVLAEVYQALAVIDAKRRAALSKAGGR